MLRMHVAALLTLALSCACASQSPNAESASEAKGTKSCFLLYDLDGDEIRRDPDSGCAERITPASTFKIPHALAALDAGVIHGADDVLRYDGVKVPFPSWGQDHSLQTAMQYSVVWYFQLLADQLGPEREREYLAKFDYGNQDASGRPRGFWLEDSLLVSPEEQAAFLLRFYRDELPVSPEATSTVREILVQSHETIVNATGRHPFAAPWPNDAFVSAKTGSGAYDSGLQVRWLVGHVKRHEREWVFVSSIAGFGEVPSLAAIDMAAAALKEESVL
jgi:beta-lactamase class D